MLGHRLRRDGREDLHGGAEALGGGADMGGLRAVADDPQPQAGPLAHREGGGMNGGRQPLAAPDRAQIHHAQLRAPVIALSAQRGSGQAPVGRGRAVADDLHPPHAALAQRLGEGVGGGHDGVGPPLQGGDRRGDESRGAMAREARETRQRAAEATGRPAGPVGAIDVRAVDAVRLAWGAGPVVA